MSDAVYKWRHGGWGVTPTTAGLHIEKLRKKNKSRVTPTIVLDDARSKFSPLHKAFDWDDKTAAEAHRLEQAGNLIRDLIVVIRHDKKDEPRELRAFVSVEREGRRGYTSLDHAMGDADLRRQVVEQALHELEVWRRQYKEYSELADIFSAIDRRVKVDA